MPKLTYEEVFCNICLGILIEPVSLPCRHAFCLACFQNSVNETSYCCPNCRMRISNWLRASKKKNTIVDVQFWNKIQQQFAEQIDLKIKGKEDGISDLVHQEYRPTTKISNPGEVGSEFKKHLDEVTREAREMEEKERIASLELIKKLQEEEEQSLNIIRTRNNSILKEDEALAKKLEESSKMLKTTTPPSSKRTLKRIINKPNKGPLDQFLTKTRNKEILESRSLNNSCNSNDSLQSEMQHFKPILCMPKTPPKTQPDGKVEDITVRRVTPIRKQSLSIDENDPSGIVVKKAKLDFKKIQSPYSAFRSEKNLPLKDEIKKKLFCDKDILKERSASNLFIDTVEEDEAFNKSTDTSGNNEDLEIDTQDYLTNDFSMQDKLLEEQIRIEKMFDQEKKDRELALQLKRQWDLLDKKQTPKRKYQLRRNSSNNNTPDKNQPTILESLKNKNKKITSS